MRGASSLLCLLVPRHCIHKKHVEHVLKKFLHIGSLLQVQSTLVLIVELTIDLSPHATTQSNSSSPGAYFTRITRASPLHDFKTTTQLISRAGKREGERGNGFI